MKDDDSKFNLRNVYADGALKTKEIYVTPRVKLARLETGEIVALNYASVNPSRIDSVRSRREWASFIGIPYREVQNYIRRKTREERAERVAQELIYAKQLLTTNGYTVLLEGQDGK